MDLQSQSETRDKSAWDIQHLKTSPIKEWDQECKQTVEILMLSLLKLILNNLMLLQLSKLTVMEYLGVDF